MRRASKSAAPPCRAALTAALAFSLPLALAGPVARAACDKPVYLTFDTGHMEVAP